MSYDIQLVRGEDVVKLPESHDFRGGTYIAGGTKTAWLNVTYNYARILYRVMGENGIRSIYGLTGAESIPVLEAAIAQLKDDIEVLNYWTPTEGNVRSALKALLAFAKAAPDAIWEGD